MDDIEKLQKFFRWAKYRTDEISHVISDLESKIREPKEEDTNILMPLYEEWQRLQLKKDDEVEPAIKKRC